MTSLILIRRIAARPTIVFDMLTMPDGIRCWWGPDDGPVLLAESDPRVDGSFRVRFCMLDGTEHEASGRYVEVVPPTRLVMTWRWTEGGDAEEAGHESRVVVALRPIEIGTELTFTHERLQTEASRDSHQWGWNGALDKLERHFAGAAP